MSVRRGYRVIAAATVLAAIGAAFLVGCDTNPAVPEAPDAAAADAWRLVTPRPFPVTITGLWADPVTLRTMAVGRFGALLVKEGSTWRPAPSPTKNDIFDIHGCDWEHIYITAADGVYRFDGRHWSRTGPFPLPDPSLVWCRAPDDVMVVARSGDSYHFDGRTWTHQTMSATPPWQGRWLTGTEDGYLALAARGAMVRWRADHWESPVTVGDGDLSLRAVCRREDTWSSWPEYVIGAYDGTIFGVVGDESEVIDRADGFIQDLETGIRGYYALVRRDGDSRILAANRHVLATFAGIDQGVLLVVPLDRFDDSAGDLLTFGGGFGTLREGWWAAGWSSQPPVMQAVSGGYPMAPNRLAMLPSGEFFGSSWREPFLLHGYASVVDTISAAGTDVHYVVATQQGDVYLETNHGGLLRLRPDGSYLPLDTPEDNPIADLTCDRDGRLWVFAGQSVWRGDGQTWERVVTLPGGFTPEGILATGPDNVYLVDYDRVAHWDGRELAEFRDAEFQPHGAILTTDGSGVYCSAYRWDPDVMIDSGIFLVRPDGATLVAAALGIPTALSPAADGGLLAIMNSALFRWRGGAWEAVPHPATAAGLPIDSVVGNPAAGYYTVTRTGVIHYLDTGGTGLWQ